MTTQMKGNIDENEIKACRVSSVSQNKTGVLSKISVPVRGFIVVKRIQGIMFSHFF